MRRSHSFLLGRLEKQRSKDSAFYEFFLKGTQPFHCRASGSTSQTGLSIFVIQPRHFRVDLELFYLYSSSVKTACFSLWSSDELASTRGVQDSGCSKCYTDAGACQGNSPTLLPSAVLPLGHCFPDLHTYTASAAHLTTCVFHCMAKTQESD